MNIFNKAALQSMKNSRTRTIVTVVGVILSTAMITAVAAFGTSLLAFLAEGSIVKHGNWHVEFPAVSSSFAQERSLDDGVAGVTAFDNVGYAVLEGAKSPEKPYLFIAGFHEETFHTLPISLISGRLPENSHEVLVPSHIAAKAGVRFSIGDTISLAVGNRADGSAGELFIPVSEKTYTVVGLCERPAFEEHSAPGYTLITKADPTGRADSLTLFVTLKNPRMARTYADSVSGSGTYILNDDVLRFMGVSDNKLFNALVLSVGGILISIIMVGSVFLIYNSFNISMNERTHQFGILTSVGATAKQLRNSVLFEGLCIGIAGIPIGILVGISSIGLILPVVAKKFSTMISADVPLTLSVSLTATAAAAAVSLVTILISAYIPARKAAAAPVMESIRQTSEIKADPKDLKTSKLTQRIYGFEGTLAMKNFKRNKKRYRSIVLSLILSVALFVSGNSFNTALKLLSGQLTVDIDYDILFTAGDMDDGSRLSLYDRLKSADGIYDSVSQTVFEYSCTADAGDLSDRFREYAGSAVSDGKIQIPMYLQLIDDSKYLHIISELNLPIEEYTGKDGKRLAFARQKVHNQGGETTEVFDVFAKNSITLDVSSATDGKVDSRPASGVNAGIFDTYYVDLPPISPNASDAQTVRNSQDALVFIMTVPYSLKDQFETQNLHSCTGFGFYSKNPLQSVGEMETMIQEAGVTSDYTLYSVYAVVDQFRSLTFVIDVFTFVFVMMISLIAVANVFNTISTNIKLRRRELAMLRSIGMSERSFNRMMCFECLFYGTRTLLYGLPISGIISWLIYKGISAAEKTDQLAFKLPWASMGISALFVFLIVFVTMLYAVSRIKKENIIDALRDDIT